jgi:hypothetical protein
MRVTFSHPGGGNAYKSCLLKVFNICGAAIVHTGTQTAYVLVDHFGHAAFKGNPTNDTLWYQFGYYIRFILEIPVL